MTAVNEAPASPLRCAACGEPAASVAACPECKRGGLCGPCALHCSLEDIWGPDDEEAQARDVPSDELDEDL